MKSDGKARAEKKIAKADCKKAKTVSLSKTLIVKDIMLEAKIVGIKPGAAEKFAEKVAVKVTKWAERRASVTESDINSAIAKEINKYSRDLAFIYKNRGKII